MSSTATEVGLLDEDTLLGVQAGRQSTATAIASNPRRTSEKRRVKLGAFSRGFQAGKEWRQDEHPKYARGVVIRHEENLSYAGLVADPNPPQSARDEEAVRQPSTMCPCLNMARPCC